MGNEIQQRPKSLNETTVRRQQHRSWDIVIFPRTRPPPTRHKGVRTRFPPTAYTQQYGQRLCNAQKKRRKCCSAREEPTRPRLILYSVWIQWDHHSTSCRPFSSSSRSSLAVRWTDGRRKKELADILCMHIVPFERVRACIRERLCPTTLFLFFSFNLSSIALKLI